MQQMKEKNAPNVQKTGGKQGIEEESEYVV
jgi:hypothetical protein